MIITYFRSSSIGTYQHCPMKYYMTYVLGYPSPANIKAEKGNVLHKVLECLAQYKLALQNKETSFTNDSFGEIQANDSECNPRVLLDKAFEYYKSKSEHKWADEDKEDCWKWVQVALEYQNGRFDPRKNKIISPEKHFDIEIPRDWADYSFKLNDETISGKLRIKGTIDLLQDIGDNAAEIVDYKTGRMFDWLKGVDKTEESLKSDFQLKLYYYACRMLFPKKKDILVTIYYLNTGGPVTIAFNDNTIQEVEIYLKEKFNQIKGTLIPQKNVSFERRKLNCTWCEHYKNKIGEDRRCGVIHKDILTIGIKKTTEKYMQNRKGLETYGDGGGSTEHGNKGANNE